MLCNIMKKYNNFFYFKWKYNIIEGIIEDMYQNE